MTQCLFWVVLRDSQRMHRVALYRRTRGCARKMPRERLSSLLVIRRSCRRAVSAHQGTTTPCAAKEPGKHLPQKFTKYVPGGPCRWCMVHHGEKSNPLFERCVTSHILPLYEGGLIAVDPWRCDKAIPCAGHGCAGSS